MKSVFGALNWAVARDPALQYLDSRTRLADRRLLLRPMSAGEVLDLSLRTFRSLGGPILRLTAVPTLLCYLVVAFFSAFVLPGMFWTRDPASLETQAVEVVAVLAIGLFVAFPLFLMGLSYISGLVTRLVSDQILGNLKDEISALHNARSSFWTMTYAFFRSTLSSGLILVFSVGLLLGSAYMESVTRTDNLWPAATAFVATFGIFVGFLIMPFAMSMQSLAPACVVLEGRTAKEASKRSKVLLKGTRGQESGFGKLIFLWSVCGFIFLAVYLGTATGLAVFDVQSAVRGWLGTSIISQAAVRTLDMLPVCLAFWLIIPMWSATTTLIYYDRRIRLEGYDIDVLSMDARRTSRQARFQL